MFCAKDGNKGVTTHPKHQETHESCSVFLGTVYKLNVLSLI